jgi:hypothetical protein
MGILFSSSIIFIFGPFWSWPIRLTVGILRLLGAEFSGRVSAGWSRKGEAKQTRGPALLPLQQHSMGDSQHEWLCWGDTYQGSMVEDPVRQG